MNLELVVVSLILIYLVFSTTVLGQSFLKILGLENYSINQISIGFQLIVIIFSSLYVFNFPAKNIFQWNFIIITLILIALIVLNKSNIKIKFSYGQILILILSLLIFIIFDLLEIRFHSSPDNHGLASTVSFMIDFPNLRIIQDSFMLETGSEIPAHLGQKTIYLDSTWNVLDSRLRFASDSVLTVGRIGLPIYIATLLSVVGNSYFTYLLIIMCIFMTWLYIINLIELSQNGSTASVKKNLILLMLLFSPIHLIWIIQGTVNQIGLLFALSSIFQIQYSFFNKPEKINFKSYIIISSIPLVYLGFTYPQGAPIALIYLAIVHLMFPLNFSMNKIIIGIFISVLSTSLVIYTTLKYVYIRFLLDIVKGVSGAPFELGSINIFESLFWIFGGVEFTRPDDSKRNYFGEVNQDYRFDLIINSIIIFVILAIIAKKKISFVRKIGFTLFAMFPYILILRFILSSSNSNSYIYVRYLALLITSVIALFFIISNIYYKGTPRFQFIMKVIIIFIALSQVFLSALKLKDFQKNSDPFLMGFQHDKFQSLLVKDSLFLSFKPEHKFFALTLFGTFNYLTDGWNPRLRVDNQKVYNVYFLENINKGINVRKLGTFEFDSSLSGPLYISDIIKYKLKD